MVEELSDDYSLTEISNAFGGHDHTNVIHACRNIEQLQEKILILKKIF